MIDDQPAQDTAFLYELAREAETTELVAYLRRGTKPLIRRRAAELLGDLSNVETDDAEDEIIEALIQAVYEDDDDSVRARAIDALYRYDEDSLNRLVDEMMEFDAEDASDWVTARALENWLDADYPEFRMVAATALGRIGDESVLSALLEATTDENPRVRARAVQSCGLLGDTQCIPYLQDRLEDPNRLVRREAITALGSIGTKEALESLIPVARVDEESLRRVAIEELGQFGSLDPVVVLMRALTEDTESVQRAAMLSLIRLFVEAPAEGTQRIRDAVVTQLANADTEAVVPILVDVMEESNRVAVRRNAAWLLGRIADTEADYRDDVYDCLIDALGDQDETTAELAAAGLSELGGDELERRLRILVHEGNVSDAAIERAERVLEGIGSNPSSEVVTNAVDYTYVRDPADYTENHGEGDGDTAGEGEL